MRKIISLALATVIVFTGCAVTESTEANRPEYPFDLSKEVSLPSDGYEYAEVTVNTTVSSLDEFAEAADALVYLSYENGTHMEYLTITEDFSERYENNGMYILSRGLQTGILSHNFLVDYDLDRFESERLIGIEVGFSGDYASGKHEDSSIAAVGYDFYQNVLAKSDGSVTLENLPLFKNTKQALKVTNSDQLFYAVSMGYVPIATEGSIAKDILSRAVLILEKLLHEGMSETEIYQAIYQYTIYSNLYDYETLLNDGTQNNANQAMFLEGSMLNGIAVCDGLTKEIVLLSRLMGIETYHVAARNDNSAHAYVYVKVDGNYYLSCTTSGNNRMPITDTSWLFYHTNNFVLTDLDTNVAGWEWTSLGQEGITESMRDNPKTLDYWKTTVVIDGKEYSLRPETVEDALVILEDAKKLSEEISMPVEIELCGSVDILKGAYDEMKNIDENILYLSTGTYEGSRLQTYVFGVNKNE